MPHLPAFSINPGDEPLLGKDFGMNRIMQKLRAFLTFVAAGPGGRPIVTHHHLHKE